MTLGERIAQARKEAGLSQEQLGEKLNVSRQAISKWESDQTNPDVAYVAQMCRLFGVSSDWLLLGEDGSEFVPLRCPSCQKVVTGLEKFCPNCGHDLSSEDDKRLQDRRYTLMVSHVDSTHMVEQQLARFYRELIAREDATYELPSHLRFLYDSQDISMQSVAKISDYTPTVICRQADYEAARLAKKLLDGYCFLSVYPAEDASSPDELSRKPPIAALSSQRKRGESPFFWRTVGAVVTGILLWQVLALLFSFLLL